MAERGATPQVPTLGRRALALAQSFTSPLLPDDYIELINPLWSTRELRGRVERVEPETDEAVTVTIKPGWEWPGHTAGQYVRLGIEVDGRFHWRAYSLTSDPGRPDGCISITPKLVHDGDRHAVLVRAPAPGHDRPPRRRGRHVRAARPAARSAAVHQRGQRRDADREHAAQPRRRRARCATSRTSTARATRTRRSSPRSFARSPRASRLPPARAPQRPRRAPAARGARRRAAPTGASARRSCAVRPGCSRRSKRASRPTATPRAFTTSTSSPTP